MMDGLKMGLPILLPVLAILVVEFVFVRTLQKRDGQVEFFDIGIFFSAIVVLYSLFPCITSIANGFVYSALSDGRFFREQPTPTELASIFWYYFLFLTCFTVSYCWKRGGDKLSDFRPAIPETRVFWTLVGLYLCVRLFFVFLRIHYNIKDADSYGESYLIFSTLPLFFQQLANHLAGIALTLQLLLMAYMVFSFKKYKSVILVWILIEFVTLGLVGVGARSGLFALLFAFLITYHLVVKRLTKRVLVLICLSAVLLFVALGVVRALSDPSMDEGVNLLNSSNEFDSLLANAYDIRNLKAAGETREVYPNFYVADFMNLIPQQLSPFHKLDLADWYVQSFYPAFAERGGGLGFGVIPESILGNGWFDIIWRGALLGWVFAFFQKRLLSFQTSFWTYGFFLWLTVLSYNCFRTGTFVLVPRAIYQFCSVFVLCKIILWFLGTEKRTTELVGPIGEMPLGGAQ
jgi:hypothetical protein